MSPIEPSEGVVGSVDGGVEKLQSIYNDGTYLRNNPTWHQEDSSWKANHIFRMLERNALRPSTVCEVGCGAGEILNQLSQRLGGEISFYGYELSDQAFALCEPKARRNLRFIRKDPFAEENRTFDVVMAIDVVEHVEDYWSFLRKLRDKGTHKILHIPLDLSIHALLRNYVALKRRTLGHIHYFTKETALATLEDTGYSILDYFYTCRLLEDGVHGWKARSLRTLMQMLSCVDKDLAVRILGGCSLMVLGK
jgi:SAM-dependent methyltransferase